MLKFGKGVVKYRIPILILSFLLLIPSAFGYFKTRINYDILYYLPQDIETMVGQDILLNDFGKGAYAMVVVEGLEDKYVAALKSEIEDVPHVADVLWYDSIADLDIPMEVLPDEVYDAFNSDNATMMMLFFDTTTSADETMEAIEQIRTLGGEQAFLSGMSAIVTDTKNLVEEELVPYVLIAVALSFLVLAITMDSFLIPILFLLSIGMAIIYNLGSNIIKGEISFITMALAAVLQLGVTMDYSIFLWGSYKEEKENYSDHKEAMAHAIAMTITSVVGSSLTTVAGFIALCFMTFTLGLDLGVVMAKGVVLGVIACVTILPSMILVLDKAIEKTTHKALTLHCEKLAHFVTKNHVVFAVLMVILWIPSIIGYKNMNVYYNLDSSLPDYLPSVQANTKLDEEMGMNAVHIILADSHMSSKDAKAMLKEIRNVDGVQMALGMDSIVGSMIPDSMIPSDVSGMLKGDHYQLMLVTTKYKTASDEVNNQITELQEITKKYDENSMVIGEAACTKDLINITDRDFKVVNIVSIAAIFILILLVLKSFSLPVILVVVIELAIYINLGLCWFLGTTEPFIASVVIGTVQLGATVDYAILMTNRFKRERASGKSKTEAVETALAVSIPSILASALGFFAATIGVGIYSDVDLIGSLCMLMARGALISMVVVILILPSMLYLFDGLIQKTSWGLRGKVAKKRAAKQQ
ncbi:MAG: MMPL family transporter [Lachnospiraceae bacterium]|nr:MMPL family transporter [Lachnospiraceae bacterium]